MDKSRKDNVRAGAEAGQAATIPGPKPGDFMLGSPESRAAARAMAEKQAEGRTCIVIVTCQAKDGKADPEKPRQYFELGENGNLIPVELKGANHR
jgi:hypothetical protein